MKPEFGVSVLNIRVISRLTCDYSSCLTPCHQAFVSNSCHFSCGTDVLLSLVSLRAVYRHCLVRVESLFCHCDDGLRIGRAAYRHHCFTDAAYLKETDR